MSTSTAEPSQQARDFLAFADAARARGAVSASDGTYAIAWASPPAPEAPTATSARAATHAELAELADLRAWKARAEELG